MDLREVTFDVLNDAGAPNSAVTEVDFNLMQPPSITSVTLVQHLASKSN